MMSDFDLYRVIYSYVFRGLIVIGKEIRLIYYLVSNLALNEDFVNKSQLIFLCNV